MKRLFQKLSVPGSVVLAGLVVAACGSGSSSGPQSQTISFSAPTAAVVVGGTTTLAATASSGLAVSYASNSTAVCTVNAATVTAVSVGTCSITASQAGNAGYNAAASQTVTFTIGQASQTISFSPPSSTFDVGNSTSLSGTASSGLTVSYTSNSTGICTVSGSTVTGVSSGTCSISADQAGNANYTAAPTVTTTFSVSGDPQTITFAAPTAPSVGNSTALTATSTSNLTVAFTASPSSVCTVSGTTLTAVAGGACTITASQAGDATFAAAASVAQTITIASAAPAQVVFSAGFPTSGSVTASGGGFGTYEGTSDTNAGPGCNGGQYCGSGLGAVATPANNGFYFYLQSPSFNTSIPSGYAYMGIFVQAPNVTSVSTTANTPGLTLNGQTSISFTYNNNPEWAASANSNFVVILTLGNYLPVNGNPCNVKLEAVVAATGGATATAYTVPLSQFVVAQNCGIGSLTPTSVTAALTGNPVSQVDFQADGGGAAITVNGVTGGFNSTVANGAGYYPTTLALTGAITFQ